MNTKTKEAVGRRTFMKQASAVMGAVSMPCLLTSCATQADIAAKSGRTKAEFNKIAADLEEKSVQYLSIAPDEGRLLHLLIRTAQARSVLELGTCFGLGTIWMGLALEETGGRMISMEIMSERMEQAKKLVAEVGLNAPVTLTQGDAHDLVPKLAGSFDLVVLNADKSGNLDYFKKLHPKLLKPNAMILAMGSISRRGQMQEYLTAITAHPDFDSVALSATKDDGLIMSSRRPV
jgi:predicted O-methyltransferase YrrM